MEMMQPFPRVPKLHARGLSMRTHLTAVKVMPNLVPKSFVPLDQRSENESSGSIHFQITIEITEFCISGFTAHARAVRSLLVWYLWRMPEMDAPRADPRALVFRPLVKGNEALGTRLG